jgi:hypothetical protein
VAVAGGEVGGCGFEGAAPHQEGGVHVAEELDDRDVSCLGGEVYGGVPVCVDCVNGVGLGLDYECFLITKKKMKIKFDDEYVVGKT